MSVRVLLDDPAQWVAYLAPVPPKRLIVFVHGFYGSAGKTWSYFQDGDRTRPWWRESDLLFVGYDSARDEVAGVAYELRDRLPEFYPFLPPRVTSFDGIRFRDGDAKAYSELHIVGHSLGGVIVRYALLELASQWLNEREIEPNTVRPALLDAQLCLFSPASAGFRPGGKLGLLRSTQAWRIVEMHLRKSTAYTDLDPESKLLANLRQGTESLYVRDRVAFSALSAKVAWARPDNIVRAENYRTDRLSASVKGASHRGVCKPTLNYDTPWRFVEAGEVPRS